MHIHIRIPMHTYIYTAISNGKRKPEAQAFFPNPFTVYSSYKQKHVVSLFVDKETNGSQPFTNGLNRLAHLLYVYK